LFLEKSFSHFFVELKIITVSKYAYFPMKVYPVLPLFRNVFLETRIQMLPGDM